MNLKIHGFGLMLLLLLVGCGSQDRYEVVAPASYSALQPGQWGTVGQAGTVWNSGSYQIPVFLENEIYFGVFGGKVYRVDPAGLELLPQLENDFYMKDLIEGPDHHLWLLGLYGKVLRLEQNQWLTEVDLDLQHRCRGLLVDDQGRVLVYGDAALWRRETDGRWLEQELPEEVSLRDGWSGFGRPPVLVSSRLNLVQEGVAGWEVGPSLNGDMVQENQQIQGSEDGRLLVYSGSNQLFLNEGGDWFERELPSAGNQVFWLQNNLYCLDGSTRNILRWQDDSWTACCSFSQAGDRSCTRSIPMAGGRLLVFTDGLSFYFDGETLDQRAPLLGEPKGMARHEGQTHILLSSGAHLQFQAGLWRVMGYPLSGDELPRQKNLLQVDDQDHLVFFGKRSVVSWTGADYQTRAVDEELEKIFPQADGRVVAVSDTRAGLWAEGQFQWLDNSWEAPSAVMAGCLDDQDRLWLVARHHLRLLEKGATSIPLTFQGWSPWGGVWDPNWGLVCFGPERLVVINGNSTREMTPYWQSNTSLDPGDVAALAPDGLGGWVALDDSRDALLHFDGEFWQSLDYNFWNQIDNGGYLTNNGDGTFFLYQTKQFVVNLGGGP